ncbi:protein kinase domain-containing protein [Frigoriglobus tundricola]|uniref:non-specific serine/threonine protein kinase n=1 Tax=Frigoriglobus tundricola TaxID=2774151 RepID=A0A6M5YLN8_9BACT|nr:protein kinase [Frigoriglobus tundricola]QJW94878.1 hypothetical protein FTUN_2404 [Frigoriglobus tundricola]
MTAPAEAGPVPDSDRTQAAPEPGASAETVVGNPDRLRAFRHTFGPPAAPGEVGTLGPYRVVKQLGRGGMGAVYAALDTRLDRRLALKVMLPDCAADAEAKERFLREARAAAQVAHDNVVTVFEADERDGVPYIAMQYLEGYPLDEFLKRKGCPTVPQVLRIVRETAAGLAAAHKIGLVHRDIKPGNLWLEAPGGRVKVLDFGLAKPVHTAAELTARGMVVGTPAYMSPEQARGHTVDARSDLFSLGAVMYRLCTNRLPFEGPTAMAVLMALGTEEPVPVRERNPAVPEPVAALVHQLLAKAPADRPQSAAEVLKRVQAVAQGTGASQVVVTPAPRVVYVPIHVTAVAAANPFTDLDAPVAEPAPPAPVAAPDAPPAPKKARRSWLWPAVGAAVALAAAAVAAAAVIGNTSAGPKPEAPDSTPVATKGRDERPPLAAGPKPATGEPDRKAAEWVLSLGGAVRVDGQPHFISYAAELPKGRYTLTTANLAGMAVTDDDLARLKDCKGLTGVALQETKVTDAGLAHLKDVPGLQLLNFDGTALTDAGAAQIKRHSKLTVLYLSRTKVSDAGLAHLKELPGLQELYLNDTRVTDAGLAHLTDLKALSVLALSSTAVTDAGLTRVKELRELTQLFLSATSVSDTGLAQLKELKRLKVLELNETPVTDAGPDHIKGLNQLESLSVRGTKVTDAGLAHLAGHPSLRSLRLTSTAVTDTGMAHLRTLRALSELHLDITEVTDAGLVHLNGRAGLAYLNVSKTRVTERGARALHASVPGCQIISDAGIFSAPSPDRAAADWVRSIGGAARGRPGPNDAFALTRVNISRAHFGDPELVYLKNLKELEQLHLDDTPVTDAGLARLKDLKTLKVLDLSGTALTDAGLAHLNGFEHLHWLHLGRTALTDAGLDRLKELKGLKLVHVGGTMVTEPGIKEFQAAVPGCVVEREGGLVPPGDYDRATAEWVLSCGGTVRIRGQDREIKAGADLPGDRFVLTGADLSKRPVADAHLVRFRNCAGLTSLSLQETKVTAAGLAHLTGLKGLKELHVTETGVTATALAEFRAAVPGCRIESDGTSERKK